MSEKSYELLCKMFSSGPERIKVELESILGKNFMGCVSGNFSDFERINCYRLQYSRRE